MSMVCGLDLHRGQITFDTVDTESGEAWRGRLWRPDRARSGDGYTTTSDLELVAARSR